GLFKSTDSGARWASMTRGLRSTFVLSLVVDPARPSTIFAGTAAGLYKSEDGGESWSMSSNGLTNLFVTSLALRPITPGALYAGTNGEYSGAARGAISGPPCG